MPELNELTPDKFVYRPVLCQMTPDELMKFHDTARAHPRIVARELWPSLPVGSIAAARDLAHYATNLATAKSLLNSPEAEKYLKICARIKTDLPAYALPLLGDTPEAQ